MKYFKTHADFLNEASRRKVHKAAKQGSYPAVIVVVQDGKVIHQEPVSTPDIAPATFNVMQEKYPKAVLHLEDNTGKRLFSESIVTEAKRRLSFKDADITSTMDLSTAIDALSVADISWDQKGQSFTFDSPEDLETAREVLQLDESIVNEKLTRGLKPLLTIGSTITKKAGEDALLDLSDKFDRIDDEYAGTIASWLDMAIELMQDGYSGDATKKLKQFNKACKDVLNGKEVGSAFESLDEGDDTIGGLNKMANNNLERIADYANMIKDRMSQGQTLDAWMYSKISDSVKSPNGVLGHAGKVASQVGGFKDFIISESVNEARFNKKSLMKAMKKDDGMIQLGNGQEYVIYNPNNGNDDNADMWQDKVIFGLDQDGEEHEIEYSDIVRYDESRKINLKQDHLSSEEYQKAKKLKDFNKGDWRWNNKTSLYDKVNELNELTVNEGKFDSIDVKDLHFEIDPKTAEEMKIELGKRQGEINKRKQIEGGEYSLRRFRKEIKYDTTGKDLDVFRPGSYMSATSTLGDGPHKKTVKAKRWNQKLYDKWIAAIAYDNDGMGQDSSFGFEMAQNAKQEPGLIDWVKKNNRGEDPMQRIQWDIEAAM